VTEATSAGTGGATATPAVTHQTVEALVRDQLSKALGGKRGMLEGAIPTLAFTVCLISSGRNLKLSLAIAGALAVALLVARLVQRSSVQFVLNSAIGIAIAAVFALRSGRAEDAFLPGLIYNAAYGAVMVATVVVRWPLLGFMLGSITGDPTGWHRDRAIVRLCSKLTLVLAAPCVVRVIVQYPLWATHHAGWLGVAKLAMGWPLQVAALAVMAWMLNRDETPIEAGTELRPSTR
jgi:hypothetical protein